jgi:hypothetical protein
MTSGVEGALSMGRVVSTAETVVTMSPAMTSRMKVAALYLTVSLGCVEAVLETERKGSARHTKLLNLVDHINRVVDVYRLEAFPIEDMMNGGRLIDLVNDELKLMYPEVN